MESDQFETTRADNVRCPECKVKFKRLDGPGQPGPGAFLLCGSCAAIMVLDDALQARKPDPEELREALASDEVRIARQLVLGRRAGRQVNRTKWN
jgi:hypothetical protein